MKIRSGERRDERAGAFHGRSRARRAEQQAAQRVVDKEEEKRVAGLLARRGARRQSPGCIF